MKEGTASLWRLPARSWLRVARKVSLRLWEDELLGRGGELAYFFLLSVFPLLLFLTTLLGYLAGASIVLYNSLFRFLARVSPSPEITDLLQKTLSEITEQRSGAKLYLSLATALWLASSAMLAISRTLNAVYGVRETRRIWWLRFLALLLTVSFALLIATGLALLFYGVAIGETMAERLGIGELFIALYQTVQWPLALLFLVLSFDMIYNFAPDLKKRRRHWLTPGAVTATALWLGASYGLRVYLSYFHTYTTAYGSLGAVMLLLFWFYLTALAVLIGGEVDSEILQALGFRHERVPHPGSLPPAETEAAAIDPNAPRLETGP